MTPHMPDLPFRSVDSLGGADQGGPKGRSVYVHFAKHFAVMVVLMYAGMFVLDPLYDLGAGVAGVSDPWGRLPVLSNVIMALNMTVPMALYMRHTRHTWRAIGEMSAAMLLPAALTTGPYLLGTMTAGAMMALSHATMIPLMAVAMILRFREYAPAATTTGKATANAGGINGHLRSTDKTPVAHVRSTTWAERPRLGQPHETEEAHPHSRG